MKNHNPIHIPLEDQNRKRDKLTDQVHTQTLARSTVQVCQAPGGTNET